jgi:hypothetical protein
VGIVVCLITERLYIQGSVFDASTGAERLVLHVIVPPMPLRKAMYRCETFFHTEYMASLYQEHDRVALVLLGGEDLFVYAAQGTRVTLLEHATLHNRMNKHSMGGSSSNRYQHIRQNQLSTWIKKICQCLTHHLVDGELHQLSVSGVFLGYLGNDMPTQVLASSWLHPLVSQALKKTPKRMFVVQDLVLSQLQAQCGGGGGSAGGTSSVDLEHDAALEIEIKTLSDVRNLDRIIYGPQELASAIRHAELKTLYVVFERIAWLEDTILIGDSTRSLLQTALDMGCIVKRLRIPSTTSTLFTSFGGILGEAWFATPSTSTSASASD